MDLELGLKITKTRDDIASISEYRLSKAGPVFQSRETNTMFILTAHLKGYKKNNININISEDGSKISISGEKPIQNILMMGWLMHRKEVDVAGFYKIFKIPDGVKLDGIKAKYDEEEWILNLLMPKLVKGICGAKIEEIKEEESDRGKSEPEKSEADKIGETSQKGSKESEVEAVEDRECYMKEKEEVSDNREIIKEKVQKEVEEPKLGTEGGIGESFGEEGGMEGLEVMKRSELESNVGRGTSQKVGDTSQKELEESKLRIEDGGLKGMREEVGKTEYEAVKTTEMEKNVGKDMSQNIGDTCQDKEFEVQKMEDNGGFVEEGEVATEKRTNDDNGNKIGEAIQKEIEESKSAIEDKDGKGVKGRIGKAGYRGIKTSEIKQNVGAHDTQNIGDTSQGVSEESVIEQMWEDKSSVEANVSTKGETLGESRQKQFGEPKPETKDRLEESEKEGSMELMETLKAPKLDQNLDDDHVPINISKEEFKKFRIQQKEETESIEDNMDGGESERMPVETNKDSQKHISGDSIQEDIKVSKIETEDEDQEYVGEKGGKEECDSMITIREEFPPQLPKAALVEESKGLSDSKLKETEDVKEAMIKRKPIEIEYFVNKGEGEQPKRMHKEDKKDLTEETAKESEDVKQAMVKREGKEIQYYVDKGKGEERKRMDMKGKKDLATETMQESDDVKEAMIKRKGKEIENYLDQGEEKDITTEKMQETEDVSEVVLRRKDKEIESFADKGEGEESRRMHMKDIQKENMQEIEEVKDETVKSKSKSIQDFLEKGEGGELIKKQMEAKKDTRKNKRQESEDVTDGEEPKTMHMERKKNLAKETIKESKEAKEAMVKREGKEIEYSGGENEQHKRMHTDAKKDLTKEKMQESKDVKEAMIKKNGKEIDYFLNEGEGQEPKRIHMEEKKDPRTERMKETEDVKVMVKRKDKEINNFAKNGEDKEPRRMLMEAKKDFTKDTMQGSEHVKEAMAKSKGKETEYFLDKSEREDPKRMHKEAKKDLTTKKKESEDIKEAKVKRKGKEIDYFLVEDEGKEPNVMHLEAKDIKKETIQDIEDVKEVKVKRRDEKIENFEDKGDGEEPMLMKTNKELTKETMEESEDAKEATAKRKGNEIEHFVDKNEGKELKRVHTEEKKDSGKKTMQESKHVKEAIVKREGKEGPKRMHPNAKKDFKNKKVHENEDVKEEMFKREGKEIDYFVGEGEDEEPKRMQIEATKDSATDTMQESGDVKEVVVKREKKEIEKFADKAEKEPQKTLMGEETVRRKFEVPTEEFHKLVGGKDGSRGLKMDEEKEMIKEPMAESESLMETVKAKMSIKNEEAGRVTEKNTATEILQKETEVSNNMVKVIFEVLGTLQANLPKQMMEAISQNKDRSEYVVVKLKGEGSIKMHVQPKEAFDEDETEDRIERDLKATSEREKRIKAVEEGMSRGEYRAEVVPEKEREKPKVSKSEEAKEASRLPLKREMEKTVQTAEDKKPKMGEIGPEFEKASGFKQVEEKMHQISEREHQRESEGVEKSKEEMSPMPKAIRKEPHELSLPIKDDKIPKIEEVQQKKEGEKAIHSLEATTSKEEELALATHSKTKVEIDESQEVQFPSPSIQTSIEEPCALDKHGMKEDDSKAESLVQIQERKEAIHSIDGSAESGVVVDEVSEPSKISSSSSTQPFEVEGKDNTDAASGDKESQDSDKSSEIDGQESTKGETDQEVEQGETLQPESLADHQYINKEKEGHGTHEIEEEKAYEQRDKVGQQDSQLLEEQNEYEEEVTGEKNNQKRSKKLFVSMMIAGSALIASGIFLFIRHRRAKNSAK